VSMHIVSNDGLRTNSIESVEWTKKCNNDQLNSWLNLLSF